MADTLVSDAQPVSVSTAALSPLSENPVVARKRRSINRERERVSRPREAIDGIGGVGVDTPGSSVPIVPPESADALKTLKRERIAAHAKELKEIDEKLAAVSKAAFHAKAVKDGFYTFTYYALHSFLINPSATPVSRTLWRCVGNVVDGLDAAAECTAYKRCMMPDCRFNMSGVKAACYHVQDDAHRMCMTFCEYCLEPDNVTAYFRSAVSPMWDERDDFRATIATRRFSPNALRFVSHWDPVYWSMSG
jgi:hypothetical protein